MAIRYDRVNRTSYCDIHNLDVDKQFRCCENPEPYWHNPDGTTNDIP